MFTGIIEEIGIINDIFPRGTGLQLEIAATNILEDLKIDHSVAVNGVCLTVVEIGNGFFVIDAVAETLSRSTLSGIKKNDHVNNALFMKSKLQYFRL